MAPKADTGVVVVVTETWRHRIAAALLPLPLLANAAILPEDRSDALYHSYEGGGLSVTGPSILVRKGDAKRFSVSANYYADSITSASIDVVTQGSEYTEARDQYSIGLDYLNSNTIMSLGYTNSEESDYKSDTYSITMSQTMFGNMTTVTIGYSRGMDDIFRNNDDAFAKTADHQNYHISLTQVLTKDLLLSVNYDTITDEGFLNNPYRSFAYEDATNNPGIIFYELEDYPDTRTSNAISANFLYYLPYRATIKAGYRFYADDWDITAHTASLAYVHPYGDRWIFETGYRYYTQSAADFYSDLFSGQNTQNFKARDKELSEFYDHSFSLGVTYEIPGGKRGFVDRATLNFKYTYIMFKYDNFSDFRDPSRPNYEFSADVIAAFASIWY